MSTENQFFLEENIPNSSKCTWNHVVKNMDFMKIIQLSAATQGDWVCVCYHEKIHIAIVTAVYAFRRDHWSRLPPTMLRFVKNTVNIHLSRPADLGEISKFSSERPT